MKHEASTKEIADARVLGQRLESLIERLGREKAPESTIRFFTGVRNNVRKIESGIIDDFIDLMSYQLRDSWQHGLDPIMDKEADDLVYGIKERLNLP
jgi:hypothetical protein